MHVVLDNACVMEYHSKNSVRTFCRWACGDVVEVLLVHSVVENDNCLVENKLNDRLVHRRRLIHVRCSEKTLNNVIRFMAFLARSIRYTKVGCERGTVRFKHTLNIKRLLFVIFLKRVQLLVVCMGKHGAIWFSVVWKSQSS